MPVVPTYEQPLLKNRVDLAKALGVSRGTLYRMERAGCPFPAGKSTVEWALAWLKDNPHFSSPRRPEQAKPAPSLAIEDIIAGPRASVESLTDIAWTAIFLLAVKVAVPPDASDKLTPGEWEGQPALFAYNTLRNFAVVFNSRGEPLGLWQEGK